MKKSIIFAAMLVASAVNAGDGDSSASSRDLQSEIDAIAKAGGGTLRLEVGTYRTGALFFKPGVNLHLEKGATIVGTDDASGYPMCETRIEGETCMYYPALINADRCDGFTITGEDVAVHDCAIIADVLKDSSGKELKGPSTDAIDIDKCRRFTVRNVDISVNDDGVTLRRNDISAKDERRIDWRSDVFEIANLVVEDNKINIRQ